MKNRRNVKEIKKGVLTAGIFSFIALRALNFNHHDDELIIKSDELRAKKGRIELDESENKTYRKQDLSLFVENLGTNPCYYFVDGSDRDIELPYLRLEQENNISIDLQKKTYQSITDPNHSLIYSSNIFRDSNCQILGRNGTIYVGKSGNVPVSNIQANGFMTNFEWPIDYENQEEFTKDDLKKIEDYYNQSYEYLYRVKNDKFAINNLSLVRVCDEFYVVDEASKTYIHNNPEVHQFQYVMECVSDPTLGVLANNNEPIRMTSPDPIVDAEFILNDSFSQYKIQDWLSTSQLNQGYLTREEIALLESQLNQKYQIEEYDRKRTQEVCY